MSKEIGSDSTLVTGVGGEPRPIAENIIKTEVLSENLCIAFAGSAENAQQALTEIQAASIGSLGSIRSLAAKLSRQMNLDFLIGWDAENPELVTVKNGSHKVTKVGWIGDHDAFRKFQKVRLGQGTDDSGIWRVFSNFKETANGIDEVIAPLKAVISDSEITSVAGFVTAITNNAGRFDYVPYAELYMSSNSAFPGMPVLTEENIRYQHAMCTSSGIEHQGIGAYFLEQQLLFLFVRNSPGNWTVTTIRDISTSDLTSSRESLGVGLSYIIMGHSAADASAKGL